MNGFVHCATPPLGDVPLAELEWAHCDEFLRTYVKASLEIVQRLLGDFRRTSAGRVIFLGTEALDAPRKSWVHYIAAKGRSPACATPSLRNWARSAPR